MSLPEALTGKNKRLERTLFHEEEKKLKKVLLKVVDCITRSGLCQIKFVKILTLFVQIAKCISSQLKEMASKINGVDFITPQSGLGKSYICPNFKKYVLKC